MTPIQPKPLAILILQSHALNIEARDSLEKNLAQHAEVIQFDFDELIDAQHCIRQLIKFAAQHKNHDLILLDSSAEIPEHALERLLQGRALDPHAVVSAMDNREENLSPQAEGLSRKLDNALAIDRACNIFGEWQFFDTTYYSTVLSYWPEFALNIIATMLAQNGNKNGPQLPSGLRGLVADFIFVGDVKVPFASRKKVADPQFARTAHALDRLRFLLPQQLSTVIPAIGLDRKPVVLHIMHGWGGGAQRFVEDLAFADQERHHLVLIAHGVSQNGVYGERLELSFAHQPQAPIFRRFDLSAPIQSVVDTHAEYRQVLETIILRFDVSCVMISSLIGHSLDVLRTGLPSIYIAHDYFPLWPELHRDFGDSQSRFDSTELTLQLKKNPQDFLFRERDALYWQEIRNRFVECLQVKNIQLVAPSLAVEKNWHRIEPRLNSRAMQIIAHAIRPFAPTKTLPAYHQSKIKKLRVLIPGRINGGKGVILLRQLLPQLEHNIEIYLLGCGAAGVEFFGRNGVDIELNYRRDDLPQHIARIQPDLALLASTVAETFSYTLSEMALLNVPVMATARGSFVDRIDDGINGILIEPNVDVIAARLKNLLIDDSELKNIRAHCNTLANTELKQFAAQYRKIAAQITSQFSLTSKSKNTAALQTISNNLLGQYALQVQRATIDISELRNQLTRSQSEVSKRGEWGWSLNSRLAQAQESIGQLQTELAQSQQHQQLTEQELNQLNSDRLHLLSLHQDLYKEFDQRSAWALQLDKERNELLERITQMNTSWSWRITKPLRFGVRVSQQLGFSLKYRIVHTLNLIQRSLSSFRTRGFGPTLSRAKSYFFGAAPNPNLVLGEHFSSPDPNETFELFEIPLGDTPQISIIVPVYNQLHYTLACLKSLAKHAATLSFEVIVVDDCSSDRSAIDLPKIAGLRIERNAENLGFIGACNRGAELARGEYLVFLNNDTQVQAGWLEALYQTFSTHQNVGLVGAKLVYPDSRLQEAGGIVFADGSGWNYGRFEDPNDPRFNYVREVDYCSGAAIMIRRDLFQRFNGFDVRYKPAYYEDTDLAFRVREIGLRAMYQPKSVVVHFEGITSGTDTNSGTKRFQVINQEKFLTRWKDILPSQPLPPPKTHIDIAREHRVFKRILICDACTPTPDQDSGSVRMVNLMQALIEMNWKVVFLSENRMFDGKYTESIQQLGVEALYHPFVGDPVSYLREQGRHFHVILLSRHYVAAPLLPVVREYAPQAKIIFDTVDLHYLREQRAAEIEQRSDLLKAAAKTKNQELRLMRSCDVTLVVSPVEAQILAREVPTARIEVLSNVHAVAGPGKNFDARRDLFFIGGFQHTPNVDAVIWFVNEIWPLIETQLPDIKFHIVGSKAPPEISALASPRILMHGYMEKIDWLLDECRLSVAPLRFGAGVKGKVNMSMAHGQPVVATPIAIEGMHAQHGEDVLIAETEQAFADAVVRLYQDAELWQKLSRNGLNNVELHFSFAAAKNALSKILN